MEAIILRSRPNQPERISHQNITQNTTQNTTGFPLTWMVAETRIGWLCWFGKWSWRQGVPLSQRAPSANVVKSPSQRQPIGRWL